MSDDSNKQMDASTDPDAPGAHGEIHLPPNSWAPILIALSLSLLFVGLLHEVRDTVGPTMWVIGLLGVIVSCASWARSARREYLELPEETHH